MKKYIRIVLVLLIVGSLLGSASASETSPNIKEFSTEAAEQYAAERQAFINYISDFFDFPDEWHAISKDGNDISEKFYMDNIDLYLDGKFDDLKTNADNQIAWLENYVDDIEKIDQASNAKPKAILDTTTLTTSTYLVYICDRVTSNYEFAVTVSGDYEYNSQTKRITSTEYPTISVYYYQFPDQGTLTLTNIKKTKSIIDNGTKASFEVTFSVYRTTDEWEPLYGGTYRGKIVGDSKGGMPVEYDPSGYGYAID